MNKIIVGAFSCFILSLPISGIVATAAPAALVANSTTGISHQLAAEASNRAFSADSVQYTTTKVRFQNCRQLNRAFRHGVGMVGARDRGYGKNGPVLNFTRDSHTFRLNAHLDMDHDRISCERH